MSVTAVPLQPIRKGSVARLSVGLLLVAGVSALLVSSGVSGFKKTETGVIYRTLVEGKGEHPDADSVVLVSYKGMLPDGTVFEETKNTPMDLADKLPGFVEAVTLLKRGGAIRAYLPADQAYRDNSPGELIPANSPLIFDISLVEFRSRAEILEMQRQQQLMQQLQQQMGGGEPPAGGVMPQD